MAGVPPCRTADMSLMTNPIIPTAPMPRRQILTDSQSSLLPGLIASLSVLAACARNDLNPICLLHFSVFVVLIYGLLWVFIVKSMHFY